MLSPESSLLRRHPFPEHDERTVLTDVRSGEGMPRTRQRDAARLLHTQGHAFDHGPDMIAGDHDIDLTALHLAGIVAPGAGQSHIGLMMNEAERRAAADRGIDAK